MSADDAIAAVVGAVVGGLAGFVAAIVQLQLKRLRNALRVRAGRAPLRDVMLPRWHAPSALVGLIASPLVAWAAERPWPEAALVGGLTLPTLLVALFLFGLPFAVRAD